jgi:hypothetical protein
MVHESKVMWTALPQGVVEKDGREYARVSAFVSIRLRVDQGDTLGAFPEFLRWPKKLDEMEFTVDFAGKKLKARAERNWDTALWEGLFHEDMYLEPFVYDDLSNNLIHSYPVGLVSLFIFGSYVNLAVNSANDLPKVEALLSEGSFGRLTYKRGEREALRHTLKSLGDRKKALSVGDLPDGRKVEAAFMQTAVFHEPKVPKPVPMPKYPQDKAFFERMVDFHQMLSSMANYPEMMRRLGLLVEMYVDADAVPESYPQAPLSMTFVSPQFQARDYRPLTAYLYDKRRFLPAPRPHGDYDWGFLRMEKPAEYPVLQFDVDGAAIKALNFAQDMKAQSEKKSLDTPTEAGVPFLRSGGFSVARTDRAAKLHGAFIISKGHEDDLQQHKPTQLHAEDLVRGVRYDVKDESTGRFQSLCWRDGAYRYLDAGGKEVAIASGVVDEAWVQTGATSTPDPGVPQAQKDLFVHESMFNWKGWSLSVPRPGRPIDTDDEVRDIEQVPATQMKLLTDFRPVKGTLPRLRYGHRYSFRGRMADLGGYGPGLEETGDSHATIPVKYLRFEPIPPPTLLLRDEIDADERPAEDICKLVIRSYNKEVKEDDHACKETAERHVAPPRIGQLEAEQAGMFDQGKGMKADAATYAMLRDMDAGRFESAKSGDPICKDGLCAMPYFPDPFASGACLRGLPTASAGGGGQWYQAHWKLLPREERRDFGKMDDWPRMLPFRIRLEEGDKDPQWDASARVLTLSLGKAERVRVRLSSYPDEERLEQMGVWNWVEAFKELGGKLDDAKLHQLREGALRGHNWMITPFRWVELVHAVQQPLGAPEIKALYPARLKGHTYADINGAVTVHGPSSAKLEMMASWKERHDDPADPGNDPVKDRRSGHVIAFDHEIDAKDLEYVFMQEYCRRHHFGDTIYRRVTYRAVATTRFKEYLAKDVREDPKSDFTRRSQEVEVDVPSAARPAAPRVAYALPIYKWSPSVHTPAGGVSKRKGSALRVYLHRPWFSSGDNEKLGVVLWPGQLPPDGDALDRVKPFVTMVGQDPIWGSHRTPTNLSLESFPGRLPESASGLKLAEMEDVTVDVAAFEPGYDHERRLWYADIEMDTGPSYTPFVRLALVRLQPCSVKGVEISPVALADFAQPQPDRTLSVAHAPGLVTVTVSGETYHSRRPMEGMEPEKGGSRVELTVERFEPSIGTDLGWVPDPEAKVSETPVALPGAIFCGTVALPLPKEPKKGELPQPPPRRRVVVREYEIITADRSRHGAEAAAKGSSPWAEGRRLVYLDMMEL